MKEFVLADYAADGANPISAFRLQINEAEFFEDNQDARYRFTMPGAEGNRPELVLTFIPEPSTGILAVVGVSSRTDGDETCCVLRPYERDPGIALDRLPRIFSKAS